MQPRLPMHVRDRLPVLVIVAIALLALLVLAARSLSAEPAAPPPVAYDPGVVQRGAELATLGDCIVCHTAPGGRSFAGGRALVTAFGTIYGTNITPDADTGIGRWSEAAFVRAMREGIAADGSRLYPAFPYDHFTVVADEDLRAIYAYLMTRDPVAARPPANRLHFPFNIRPLVGIWQALFLRHGTFAPDPKQSPEWNRGAYLVTGLAHCGACHTPRNWLGAEKRDHAFAGGEAEGWHAPPLDRGARAPESWTADALFTYLRTGVARRHDAAAGPMAAVTHNLATALEADVRAIAVYVASLSQRSDANSGAAPADDTSVAAAAPAGDRTAEAGRAIYQASCAYCHDQPRTGFSRGALSLRLSTALRIAAPDNTVQIILHGIQPPDGQAGAFMPPFAGALTDDQVSALVHYLRTTVAAQQPWKDVDRTVRTVRRAEPAPS